MTLDAVAHKKILMHVRHRTSMVEKNCLPIFINEMSLNLVACHVQYKEAVTLPPYTGAAGEDR